MYILLNYNNSSSVQHFSEAPFFASNYIQTYMRFIAYLVGITGGAILHDHRGIKRQISTVCDIILYDI